MTEETRPCVAMVREGHEDISVIFPPETVVVRVLDNERFDEIVKLVTSEVDWLLHEVRKLPRAEQREILAALLDSLQPDVEEAIDGYAARTRVSVADLAMEIEALRAMPDEEIDFSDIPELTAEQIQHAKCRHANKE